MFLWIANWLNRESVPQWTPPGSSRSASLVLQKIHTNWQTSHWAKTGWCSFQVHFLIHSIPAGLFAGVPAKEYTSSRWCPPVTITVVFLGCWVLSKVFNVFLPSSVYIRWSHWTWRNGNKISNQMDSKTILPCIWRHTQRVSRWDKSNLTLRVTEGGSNTKRLGNLSSMRGWPEGGNCQLD